MTKPPALLAALFAVTALAAPVKKPVAWKVGDTAFEGVLVYDGSVKTPRPALLMVPNWMGVTDASVEKAQMIAGKKYVILVADVYGKTVRPKTPEEAGKAAGAMKADRKTLRARADKAWQVLKANAFKAPLDGKHFGAIGFCFGGTTVLELARSGADVQGTVTFHGGLDAPTPADDKNIKGRILALNGADDPTNPPEQLAAFQQALRDAKVDWELVNFGGAVHSFTDPKANMPGRAMYDEKVAKRAYVMMNDFFADLFGR